MFWFYLKSVNTLYQNTVLSLPEYTIAAQKVFCQQVEKTPFWSSYYMKGTQNYEQKCFEIPVSNLILYVL